ncbi:hypothetical protein DV736_g3859, partial [Chaetothyriales sp. CBS 134916]
MGTSLGSDANADQDEDERSTTAQLIADLKEQVQRSEQASEQYRKHLELMQQRLDESTNDQTLAEERDFQRQTQLDRLQAEVKDAARQRRELEIAHESETRMLLQERERRASREAGLQSVINRLNETLRIKGLERLPADHGAGEMLPSVVGVCHVFTANASIPVDSDSGIGSQEPDSAVMGTHIQTLQEKDSTIEQLRLELADLHLKAAEQEHLGDSQRQVLEQRVTELRIHNARLQEENESFQMLLSEKTLKGDFMAESRYMSTLAEELETANVDPGTQTDACRKLEAELKAAREENKGLTLYIDKIIGRLLQHEGFEHIVDSSDRELPPAPLKNPIPLNQIEKALPATPGDDFATPTTTAAVTSAAQSFLKRAGSLMSRPGNARPTRPTSMAQPLAASTANENPVTAPSIPLNRGHRRSRSDQPSQDLGAAVVVQQMNRGSPLRAASGGPMSPGIRPLSPQMQPRAGYFPNPQSQSPPQLSRVPPHPRQAGGSSRNSITSDHSQDRGSTEASSLPSTVAQYPTLPGAVMKQNHLRPLRLVQERSREEEEVQKRLNRSSWIDWLKGSAADTHHEEQSIGR